MLVMPMATDSLTKIHLVMTDINNAIEKPIEDSVAIPEVNQDLAHENAEVAEQSAEATEETSIVPTDDSSAEGSNLDESAVESVVSAKVYETTTDILARMQEIVDTDDVAQRAELMR